LTKNRARKLLTVGKWSRKTAWFAYSIRSFGAGVPVRPSFHRAPAEPDADLSAPLAVVALEHRRLVEDQAPSRPLRRFVVAEAS
jgi:hypothetical protein